MSVEDLVGRPGVVYCPSEIEKGLPLDKTTLELKGFLRHFKTLDHYYLTIDSKLDPDLNSKELLNRCNLFKAFFYFEDTTIKKQRKNMKKLNTDSRLDLLNSATLAVTDENQEREFLVKLGFSEKYF